MNKDGDRRARWEMTVLSRLKNHPFLPTLLGRFETQQLLGYALPYCPGGDLNSLRYLQTDHIFSVSSLRFYASQIITALQHLHQHLHLAYRDLKPENVLIQPSGHLLLSDFDLSRSLSPRTTKRTSSPPPPPPPPPQQTRFFCKRHFHLFFNNNNNNNINKSLKKAKSARVSPVSRRKSSFSGEKSNSFVGTEEYVAPEVVRGEGHEFAVDWWALGVLMYEMAFGKTPFKGKNRKETFVNVLMKEPEFVGKPTLLTDLISKLLEKDPTRRLGFHGGADQIKSHPFFRGVQWDLLPSVSRPPFLPSADDYDQHDANRNEGFRIEDYFDKTRRIHSSSPCFSPAASFPSPASDYQRNVSWAEF